MRIISVSIKNEFSTILTKWNIEDRNKIIEIIKFIFLTGVNSSFPKGSELIYTNVPRLNLFIIVHIGIWSILRFVLGFVNPIFLSDVDPCLLSVFGKNAKNMHILIIDFFLSFDRKWEPIYKNIIVDDISHIFCFVFTGNQHITWIHIVIGYWLLHWKRSERQIRFTRIFLIKRVQRRTVQRPYFHFGTLLKMI